MRLLRGCALGDTIILLGAAVYFSRKMGKIRLLTSPYCERSISDCLVNHSEVEVFTHKTEESDTSIQALFHLDGGSLIQDLSGTPLDWYSRLGIPYSERFDSCPIVKVAESISPSYEWPVFVHDDSGRALNIPVKGHRPQRTESILDHVPALKGAKEIHCMDSSFFHLLESMNGLNAELFYYPLIKLPYPNTPRRHSWNVVT